MAEYFFDIPADFPGLVLPHTVPDTTTLHETFEASAISSKFEFVSTDSGVLTVHTNAGLDSGEVDAMDVVIAVHTGIPRPDASPEQSAEADGPIYTSATEWSDVVTLDPEGPEEIYIIGWTMELEAPKQAVIASAEFLCGDGVISSVTKNLAKGEVRQFNGTAQLPVGTQDVMRLQVKSQQRNRYVGVVRARIRARRMIDG